MKPNLLKPFFPLYIYPTNAFFVSEKYTEEKFSVALFLNVKSIPVVYSHMIVYQPDSLVCTYVYMHVYM